MINCRFSELSQDDELPLIDQSDVAEIFKTPGKLRGKTPRTARKNPFEARAVSVSLFL